MRKPENAQVFKQQIENKALAITISKMYVDNHEDWYKSVEQDFGLNARQESVIKTH